MKPSTGQVAQCFWWLVERARPIQPGCWMAPGSPTQRKWEHFAWCWNIASTERVAQLRTFDLFDWIPDLDVILMEHQENSDTWKRCNSQSSLSPTWSEVNASYFDNRLIVSVSFNAVLNVRIWFLCHSWQYIKILWVLDCLLDKGNFGNSGIL